jgi:hypothetical protein
MDERRAIKVLLRRNRTTTPPGIVIAQAAGLAATASPGN